MIGNLEPCYTLQTSFIIVVSLPIFFNKLVECKTDLFLCFGDHLNLDNSFKLKLIFLFIFFLTRNYRVYKDIIIMVLG